MALIMFFWLQIVAALFLNIFLFFDEEPLFDITDLNITHIFLVIISFLSVFWENSLRSKFGQFTYKDQTLLYSFLGYWFFLENYVYAIVIIFCFHCLTPLETELFELVEIYSCLLVWFSTHIIPYFSIIIFFYFFLFMINYNINWLNKKLIVGSLVLTLIALVVVFYFILFDFFFNSLSSLLFLPNYSGYNNDASSLTYGYCGGEFDWHKTKKNFFIVRFEDLYIFFIQLLNIVSMLSFLILLFLYTFDTLFLLSSDTAVTFSFFGVVLRFYENFIFKFFLSFLFLFLVSLRITFKYLIEFNFFIF